MTALDIQGLSISYIARGVTIEAVRDLSLTLAPGERLGLVGESGSGKTTTALAVMGMLRPPGRITAGHIRLDGTELVGLDPAAHQRLRLSRISYVPQGAMNSLNPVLRIRHSIADAIRAHQPIAGAALRQRIAALLAEVGLPPEIADRYPHQLSGGMKQRVCIALAMSLGPRVIIADEPTSALDVVTQRQVMRTLQQVQERQGSAMLLIGHDMGLMAQSVHRIAVMRHGRLEEIGDTRRILRNPASPYTAELIRSVPIIGGPSAATSPGPSALSPAPQPSLLAFDQVQPKLWRRPVRRARLHRAASAQPATASRPPPHPRHCRPKRQRQNHARLARPRLHRPNHRHRPLRRHRCGNAPRRRPPPLPPRSPGNLPRPLQHLQPVLPRLPQPLFAPAKLRPRQLTARKAARSWKQAANRSASTHHACSTASPTNSAAASANA